jgi:P27 family predicted phage terminase small subunit
MAGRRPKPTKQKKLEGNPGKRKFNPDEPDPDSEIPTMPAHLDATAKAEWKRITPQLLSLGLISEVDRGPIAAYCQAWSRWVDAEENIQRFGSVIKTPKGYPVQSPYLGIANHAMDQVRKFAIEFGMTPAARSRVIVDRKGDPDADLHALLSGPLLSEEEKKQIQ